MNNYNNAKYLVIIAPIYYRDEDIPYDFPFRENDIWKATVLLETGMIIDWPKNYGKARLYAKICDGGIFHLLDENLNEIAVHQDDYVPDFVPNDFGDYINLHIDENGFISNWDKKYNLEDF